MFFPEKQNFFVPSAKEGQIMNGKASLPPLYNYNHQHFLHIDR